MRDRPSCLGAADKSLLIEAIRFDGELRMPEGGPKLDQTIVNDFIAWIDGGAPDPRDEPPSADELAADLSWEAVRGRRLAAWQFSPPEQQPAPVVHAATFGSPPTDPNGLGTIDRWIGAGLEQHGLVMADEADRQTLIRRLALVLTGLPPTLDELERFTGGDRVSLDSDDWTRTTYVEAVDHYLASPAYGERWARHWMDWMRYADSHGSEGDPAIPHAYRYRDYLIRAINEDLPLDQMVREQLAGDQLEAPRINPDTGWNESLLGLGHLRMVQHGFAPVDPADERMRFTDNQIDVVSKAFLGLTVSCARCHDHKFDPISQRDFYAWYGILASARPALLTLNAEQESAAVIESLSRHKLALRRELAEAWREAVPTVLDTLAAGGDARLAALLDEATDVDHPLHAWRELRAKDEPEQISGLGALTERWRQTVDARQAWRDVRYPLRWNFTDDQRSPVTSSPADWFRHGTGLDSGPVPAGHFEVPSEGDRVIASIHGPGEFSSQVSPRRNGVLASPTFKVDFDELWIAVSGRGGPSPLRGTELPARDRPLVYRQHANRLARPRFAGTCPTGAVRKCTSRSPPRATNPSARKANPTDRGLGSWKWWGATPTSGTRASRRRAPWSVAVGGQRPVDRHTAGGYQDALLRAIDAWSGMP
ncbi:MAG: DUF1549 domain-containing protein [Pirellulaceae bacterium]